MDLTKLGLMLWSLGLTVLGAGLLASDGVRTHGSAYVDGTHGFWLCVAGLTLLACTVIASLSSSD